MFGFRNLGVCVLVVSVFRAGGFHTRNRSQCGIEKEERKRTFNRRTCHRDFSDRVFDDYDVYRRRCNGHVTFFRVRIVVFTTKASNRVVGSGLFCAVTVKSLSGKNHNGEEVGFSSNTVGRRIGDPSRASEIFDITSCASKIIKSAAVSFLPRRFLNSSNGSELSSKSSIKKV